MKDKPIEEFTPEEARAFINFIMNYEPMTKWEMFKERLSDLANKVVRRRNK